MKANSKIKKSTKVDYEVSHYSLDNNSNLTHETLYFDTIKEVKQWMKTLKIYDDVYIKECRNYIEVY